MQDIIEFLQFRLDLAQRIAAQRKEEDAQFMQTTQNMLHDTFGKRYVLVPTEMNTYSEPDEVRPEATLPVFEKVGSMFDEYDGPYELWIEEVSVGTDRLKVVELVKNYLHSDLKGTKQLLFSIPAFIDMVHNVKDSNLKIFCHALASNGVTTSLRRPTNKEVTWVVRLYDFGSARNKLNIVKAVKNAGCFPGLVEAKAACDKAVGGLVTVLITKDRQKVDEFCKLLEEFGAKFSLTTKQKLDYEQQEK